jgi:hypothetical protein
MFKLRKFLLEPLFFISLILVSSFMIWPPAVQSIAIVILFITLLFKIKKIEYNNINFLAPLFFIILYMLSYFWSTDKNQYLEDFQHIFGFLFALLILNNNITLSLSKLNYKKVIYIGVIVGLSVYFVYWTKFIIKAFDLFYIYINTGFDFQGLSFYEKIKHIISFRLYVDIPFARVIQDAYVPKGGVDFFYHHTYLGAFLNIVFFYSIFNLYHEKNKCLAFSALNILFGVFSIMWLFFIESKTNKGIFFINTIILFLSYFYKNRIKYFYVSLTFLIFFLSFIFCKYVYNNPLFIEKEPHMVNFSLEYFIDYTRYELYKSIYNTIKSNLVFGVGVGDIINDINSRLPTVHYDASVDLSPNSKFNTHSMYLYFLTGLGIIGFISFIYSFVSNFYYYFKRFDCYGITFLTIVLLNMSIENFFIRIWGVIFYVIFAFYNHIRIDENKY